MAVLVHALLGLARPASQGLPPIAGAARGPLLGRKLAFKVLSSAAQGLKTKVLAQRNVGSSCHHDVIRTEHALVLADAERQLILAQ